MLRAEDFGLSGQPRGHSKDKGFLGHLPKTGKFIEAFAIFLNLVIWGFSPTTLERVPAREQRTGRLRALVHLEGFSQEKFRLQLFKAGAF